jgi:hypothetical protein
MSAGLAAWKLAMQLSPIILTNGLAGIIPGRMMPMIAITEAVNFPLGLLSGGNNINLDSFFANFEPLPGATLIDQDVAKYPFANQAVAANAVISMPLQISFRMIIPVRQPFGYAAKLAIMTALREVLAIHNNSGGTYTLVTPSYIYTNCIMRGMRDISGRDSKQAQNAWQLDFEKPLITLDDAIDAQNGMMSLLSGQLPVSGPLAWSGAATAVPPSTLAGAAVIPAQSATIGAGTISGIPLAAS